MDEMITISLDEYQELRNDQAFLAALSEAGVDNWDGFAYAHELYIPPYKDLDE